MITVLVVDDSPLMMRMVSDLLNSAPNMRVVGTARDGMDAVEKTEKLRPNVVTMDLEMPKAAIDLRAVDRVVPLPNIVDEVLRML
jgi:two-component system chemotaxis response regulator CheB